MKKIKEYLQEMLDRWNTYEELDGFVAENFRTDLEKDIRILGFKNRRACLCRKLRGNHYWKFGRTYTGETLQGVLKI